MRPQKFTVVELLVVIAIISILASLLMPVLGKAIESARSAACASNLKQFGVGINMYQDTNHGWCPAYVWPKTYPVFDWSKGSFKWFYKLSPYLGAPGEVGYGDPQAPAIFKCPGWDALLAYGWNNHVADPPYGNGHPWKMSKINRPGRRMLVQDTRGTGTGGSGIHASVVDADWYDANGTNGPDQIPVAAPIAHCKRGPNATFADMHVSLVDGYLIRLEQRPYWTN